MSRYVVDLRSRSARDPRLTGGKAAGLNQLARWRFNVPDGFVITTDAFRDFMSGLPGRNAQLSGNGDGLLPADREASFRASWPRHSPRPFSATFAGRTPGSGAASPFARLPRERMLDGHRTRDSSRRGSR